MHTTRSRRILSLLLVALLAALALPAASGAVKRPAMPTLRDFVLKSAVVTEQVDWHFQSTDRRERCVSYTTGTGDQLIGYRLQRAARFTLMQSRGSIQLTPRELVRFEGDVSRRHDWRPHESECRTCGGELGECDGTQDQPTSRRPSFECGSRTLTAPQLHVVMKARRSPHNLLDRDYVSVEPVANEPQFKNCPPTHTGGPGLPSSKELFGAIPLQGGEYKRLRSAKPGATVTLSGSVKHGERQGLGTYDEPESTEGRCPSLSGTGFQFCVKQSVRAVLQRVR
jgi:hypothetical protein